MIWDEGRVFYYLLWSIKLKRGFRHFSVSCTVAFFPPEVGAGLARKRSKMTTTDGDRGPRDDDGRVSKSRTDVLTTFLSLWRGHTASGELAWRMLPGLPGTSPGTTRGNTSTLGRISDGSAVPLSWNHFLICCQFSPLLRLFTHLWSGITRAIKLTFNKSASKRNDWKSMRVHGMSSVRKMHYWEVISCPSMNN